MDLKLFSILFERKVMINLNLIFVAKNPLIKNQVFKKYTKLALESRTFLRFRGKFFIFWIFCRKIIFFEIYSIYYIIYYYIL